MSFFNYTIENGLSFEDIEKYIDIVLDFLLKTKEITTKDGRKFKLIEVEAE